MRTSEARPLTSGGAAHLLAAQDARQRDRTDETTHRVLIIDDDPVIRELHSLVLERAGIVVDAVADGPAGIAYLYENDVSLVLLDSQMPGMSGPDVLRQMRADPAISDVRVIFITALHGLEDRVAGLENGANDYLAKPVAHSELVARVRTQLNARMSDDAVRSVVESANDAHVSWDAAGIILDWNARAVDTFGWTRVDALGRQVSDTLLSAPYRPAHEQSMQRFRESGETPLHGEWAELIGLHRDGTEVPVEMTIWTVESHGGTAFHALIKDLRVRRELEVGLGQSEEVSDFVAALADIITMSDSSGLSYVSPACRAVLGYEPDELIGPFPFELIHPDDREGAKVAYQKAFTTDGTLSTTFRFRNDEGGYVWLEASGRATRGGSGTLIAVQAVWRDVSKRIALEEQRASAASVLAAANAKLSEALHREQETVREFRKLDQAKTDFISTVSHELRTPLTSITGYLEVLTDDAVIDETGARAVEVIGRNARRLLAMVEDLLTMGQIDSNRLVVTPEPTTLLPLIESALRVLQPAADVQNLEVSLAVAPGLPDVLADSGQVDRVLVNLLSNAVKFSSPYGHVSVSAEMVSGGDRVAVTISDDGIGIADDDQAQLFQRFSRSPEANELAVQGSGLGLFIVKRIVEAHGGTVELRSTAGEGTDVTFTLPPARVIPTAGSGGSTDGVRPEPVAEENGMHTANLAPE